jgi:hypothetical protein
MITPIISKAEIINTHGQTPLTVPDCSVVDGSSVTIGKKGAGEIGN